MSTKKQRRLFTIIGIVIIVALSIGLVKLNLKYEEDNTAEAESIDIENQDKDIEKEIDIPPIKTPKEETQIKNENEDNSESIETVEYKEEVKEIDGNKVLVKPTPPLKTKETPDAMKKPTQSSKPKEPPKLKEEGTDKPNNPDKPDKPNEPQKPNPALTNPEKPPTYEKEEESSIIEKDGKWYVKGVNGKLFPIDGDPYGKPDEVDSSELGRPGEPKMGEGDKF